MKEILQTDIEKAVAMLKKSACTKPLTVKESVLMAEAILRVNPWLREELADLSDEEFERVLNGTK